MVAAVLAAGLIGASPAQAREGIFAGLGVSSQTISSGLPGDTKLVDISGISELRPGKLESGTGIAFNGGFGFNEYFALELLLNVTKHSSTYSPTGGPQQGFDARLSSVLFGARVSAPLGDVAEVFLRAGLGGYELNYKNNDIRLSDGLPVDDTRLSARGYGAGVGGEMFFQHWGVQLAYTLNKADFDTVQALYHDGSLGSGNEFKTTIPTVSLIVNYYLK